LSTERKKRLFGIVPVVLGLGPAIQTGPVVRYRRARGQLYPAARLGAVILARRDDPEALRSDAVALPLDPRTAMLEKWQTRYSHARDGS